MDKSDVFWQEKQLLEKSKQVLQDPTKTEVSLAEYQDLLSSYADVLNRGTA
jgi:hypothetical protein